MTRKENGQYYLVLEKAMPAGTVITVTQGETTRIVSQSYIEAPDDVLIMRDEELGRFGGLEEVTNRIKDGEWKGKGAT